MTPIHITVEQLRRHRLRANNLAERLPPGSVAQAAYAGLQDTAPLAALMALHARVRGVQPDDWEHPTLVQTWAPRGAVYVVPRRELWVFALGVQPRGAPTSANRTMLSSGAARLAAAMTGVTLRWDTRTTLVASGEPPEGDPEEARLELARRYLRSLGPGDAERFRLYAHVTTSDARITFERLQPELAEVVIEGAGARKVLAADIDPLTAAAPVAGARLIPVAGDPVLQRGESTLFGVRASGGHLEVLGIDLPRWCVSGVILLGGHVVGAYGRRQGEFVLVALRRLSRRDRQAVEAEVWSAPIPGGISRVGWRELA